MEAGNWRGGVHWGKEAGKRRWFQGCRGKKEYGELPWEINQKYQAGKEEEEVAAVFFDLLRMDVAKRGGSRETDGESSWQLVQKAQKSDGSLWQLHYGFQGCGTAVLRWRSQPHVCL